MGKSSISRVYEDWIHLDHQPFRVLVYLALRSLDAETPPVYYAGWEEIARAANLSWDPDEPYVDHLEESERKAVLERRRRARKKYKNRVGELLRTLEDARARCPPRCRVADGGLKGECHDWQPFIREDPRPKAPTQRGPQAPTQGGPDGPAEGGPPVPVEAGKRSPGRGGPKED